MKRHAIALLAALVSLPCLVAEEGATDFLRVDQDETATRLQTAVTRYEKDGVTVELVGAVHIADQAYYDDLNKRFEAYDALLFEMVGGEHLVDGEFPEPAEGEGEGDPVLEMIGNAYDLVSRFLKLTDQKSAIDYSKKNFVHADLTLDEFTKLQEARGESVLGFAFAAGAQAAKDGQAPARQPNLNRMVTAFLAGNSNAIKMELIHSLGQGDDLNAAFAGESVIISDRNAKCLKVLGEQVARGRKKFGIFYGAAHYPEMEGRLVKEGYRKTGQEWLTAWDVPKPKKKAQPEAGRKNAA